MSIKKSLWSTPPYEDKEIAWQTKSTLVYKGRAWAENLLGDVKRSEFKYQQEHQWAADKRERQRYRRMLDYQKASFLQREVNRVKGDVKSLYRLMASMTNKTTVNPLPDHSNEKELANDFASFFLSMIQKIRDNFTGSVYSPPPSDIHN